MTRCNSLRGGVRKTNGHKEHCTCPICINMKHAKHGGGNMYVDEEEPEPEEKEIDEHVEEEKTNQDTTKEHTINEDIKNKEMDEHVEEVKNIDQSHTGGKKRKGNGHKETCTCPICKNMKKSKSTLQTHKKKTYTRKHKRTHKRKSHRRKSYRN